MKMFDCFWYSYLPGFILSRLSEEHLWNDDVKCSRSCSSRLAYGLEKCCWAISQGISQGLEGHGTAVKYQRCTLRQSLYLFTAQPHMKTSDLTHGTGRSAYFREVSSFMLREFLTCAANLDDDRELCIKICWYWREPPQKSSEEDQKIEEGRYPW